MQVYFYYILDKIFLIKSHPDRNNITTQCDVAEYQGAVAFLSLILRWKPGHGNDSP
ncbi:hypothetical protein VCR14J2_270175 [Vibrio coralliirubri]|nr:hypothetical protein VCR14J2_270175 [Vibrio coralliirubri]